MVPDKLVVNRFIKNGLENSATVIRIKNWKHVFDYAKQLAVEKQEEELAAYGLIYDMFVKKGLGKNKKIRIIPEIPEGKFDWPISITMADYGIAETGTIVFNSNDKKARLAAMISDIHLAIVQENRIYTNLSALSKILDDSLQKENNYLAFVTGPSRTADIERELTLGAHGPKELHILIVEGDLDNG